MRTLAAAAAVTMSFLMGTTAIVTAQSVDKALPSYKAVSGVSGNLKSIGSDTLNNLMTLWAEGFRSHYPNVQIEIEGAGSGTAPVALIQGTAQFGPMSRPMRAVEIERFQKRHGFAPTPVRGAIDALAVYVHKDNPIKCMSLQQVDAVFSRTRNGGYKENITTWGQLGLTGEWAKRPIELYGRNSASGTYGYFKEVAMFNGDFKNEVREQPGSSTVVQGVASTLAGIGYSGVGYKTADVRSVPLSAQPGGQCHDAVGEAAVSGDYPIARFLYVYVNKDPNRPMEPLRGEFIRYVYSRQGQEAVARAGFFPVNKALADDDLKKFGLAASGS